MTSTESTTSPAATSSEIATALGFETDVPLADLILVRPQLAEIEKQHGIKIIFAVEAGSRSFGLPSPKSDYDVRILYIHDADWYVRVDEPELKHEILFKDKKTDLDLHGYELRKAFQLLRKSNPPILEWMENKWIYHQHPEIMALIRQMAKKHPIFDRISVLNHCLSISQQNYFEYIKTSYFVNRKKYFYILRVLFQGEYMKLNPEHNSMPPQDFMTLYNAVKVSIPAEYIEDIEYLIKRKKTENGQWEKETRMEHLEKFIISIREQLTKYTHPLKKIKDEQRAQESLNEMNSILQDAVREFASIPAMKPTTL